ncbi:MULTISPECIES: hypothetical protein [unclassified Micromonospora]|uniref:hypothetical protein n=1 Tax=unclassified Micromonospora TaxID=2617518 RepID=UPI00332521E5
MTWTVYTSWRADGPVPAAETSETHLDWPPARRQGRSLARCAGARYVTVCGPGNIVVADWDRYTNLWREYALHIGACDGESEPDGDPCGGQLYARPSDVQVRCPRCQGWIGYRARGMRQPFEPASAVIGAVERRTS